jgi:hypothetical protein
VFEMQEIVKLLLKDPAYMRVGARCPRVGLVSADYLMLLSVGFCRHSALRTAIKHMCLIGNPVLHPFSAVRNM